MSTGKVSMELAMNVKTIIDTIEPETVKPALIMPMTASIVKGRFFGCIAIIPTPIKNADNGVIFPILSIHLGTSYFLATLDFFHCM